MTDFENVERGHVSRYKLLGGHFSLPTSCCDRRLHTDSHIEDFPGFIVHIFSAYFQTFVS